MRLLGVSTFGQLLQPIIDAVTWLLTAFWSWISPGLLLVIKIFQQVWRWILQWMYDLLKPGIDAAWSKWPSTWSFDISSYTHYLECVNQWVPVDLFFTMMAAYYLYVVVVLTIKVALRFLPGYGSW